ncbi:MAG TPA: branched-chain amino acid ABC transporter ATP-binding protein/permease [Actinomycetota bacterium]|nr:branched-chain amino acid ABC transporter ATP-binding protein/permease [Actinomycetota bacterium]
MAIAVRAPAEKRSLLVRVPRLRTVGLLFLVIWPWVLPAQPWSSMAVAAAIQSLALVSLVVLTGWVGQISLAQAAIMGVGAFSAAQITMHLGIDFPFHVPIAGLASAGTAVLIGLPALRIKGLYLAIATLAFQWMLEESLLQMHWFSGGFNGVTIPTPKIATYSLSNERLFYYFAWGIAALLMLLVANMRDSKTGRAWFAIRGSEIAARSMGINVTRYKLLAFAVSGFVIGVAGSLKLNTVGSATPLQYLFPFSITFLALAVLGGIGSLAGAVAIASIFIFLQDYGFPQIVPSLAQKGALPILAAALLIVQLITNPGGLAATKEKMKEDIAKRHLRKKMRQARKNPGPAASQAAALHESATTITLADPEAAARLAERVAARGERAHRLDSPALLRAEDVTIRFGGVVANDKVSLEVRRGEITGLIGPNGAGKTTHFNTLNGLLVPDEGRIHFAGKDITDMPTHERAAMGMSRTFQIMRLFPRLTVFENIMVGTHLQNTAGVTSNVFMLPRSRNEDARLSERCREILALLGIDHLADERVAGMPFGILRLVELARALVASPQLLLLDEPASGLDVSETDAFSEHLMRIRDEMGPTILLIEHDMRLVMNVSDYVYVLEFGKNLAEGVPSEIQQNPDVIAAYLGGEGVTVG